MASDRDLLRAFARWLRKHDCAAFDWDDDGEQERAEVLIDWFAESVDVLNVPPAAPTEGNPPDAR